jgi:mannitol-1-phosphate/altronate dehydrogenase
MMIDRIVSLTSEESQELELEILEQLSHSQDLSIAIESYTRKTQPVFTGS